MKTDRQEGGLSFSIKIWGISCIEEGNFSLISPYKQKNKMLGLLRKEKLNVFQAMDVRAVLPEIHRTMLGPMDSPPRRENALPGMSDAGRVLFPARESAALAPSPILSLYAGGSSIAVVWANASVYSDYSKFDPYLFNTHGRYTHRKEILFKQWGYTVADAQWLQAEMERQAKEKYLAGDYSLGSLDKYGQRINIRIEIPRKNSNETVSFVSGWMAEPGGKLRMNTPYGDK